MFMCSLEKYESLLKETDFEVLSLNDRNNGISKKLRQKFQI